jgi:hypothetical protein
MSHHGENMKITRRQLKRLIREEVANKGMNSTMKELNDLLKKNGWHPIMRGDGMYYSKGQLGDDTYVEIKITDGA